MIVLHYAWQFVQFECRALVHAGSVVGVGSSAGERCVEGGIGDTIVAIVSYHGYTSKLWMPTRGLLRHLRGHGWNDGRLGADRMVHRCLVFMVDILFEVGEGFA